MKVLVTGGSGFIGMHMVRALLTNGHEVINADIKPPADPLQLDHYRCVSILDRDALIRTATDFHATHVVHLAAHAVMEGTSIDDFKVNTQGTENVIAAVKAVPSIERVIVTSTQLVRRPGSGTAQHDEDYEPLMLYGESKVITEKLTRNGDLECAWTIIRPTLVWGPGHPILGKGLFSLISRGRYIHPKNDRVIRSYGYVKNVVWQIEQMLLADRPLVDRKTFYVADANLPQINWINAMANGLTGRNVRTVPAWFIKTLATCGDLLKVIGVPFPMYGTRFRNLTTSNVVTVQPTIDLLGIPPYSMAQGVDETVEWFRQTYQ